MGDIIYICGLLIALKLCLYNCYVSTDFEVHRNWLAITYHLPLPQWYFEHTSTWTLDYPPLFAYFEFLLSYFASLFDKSILKIQQTGFFDQNVLLFQRLTVIVSDLIFYIGCYSSSKSVVSSLNVGSKRSETLQVYLFLLLILNPCLILLDNVHFQYNSMLFGVFLIGVGYFFNKSYFKAGLTFSILLNFKHIFLYYVFAFVIGFISQYLLPFNQKMFVRIVGLTTSVVLPVILSVGPFLYLGGVSQLYQILSRLFPFKRGLTHAYWAPNFWALYNTLDFTLYKLLFRRVLDAPVYTNGQVQTYSHVVLPDVSVRATLVLVAISSIVLLFVRAKSKVEYFLSLLVMSAFSFYLFAWHVHEKAAVLIQVPLTILAFVNPAYADVCLLFTQASTVSLFPLFFDISVENMVKYLLYVGYIFIFKTIFSLSFNLRNVFDVKNKMFFVCSILLEFYKGFAHTALFGFHADFLPLLLTSLFSAVGVIYTYAYLLSTFTRLNIAISKCILFCKEVYYKRRSKHFDVNVVHSIGALDMTANVNIPNLATVSYCVFNYPELKLKSHHENTVAVKHDYTTNYLALRECIPMMEMVEISKDKPDMLFIDGNARLHAREFGLGCHLEHLSGIPTVGVAKKLSASFSQLCDEPESFLQWLKTRECSYERVVEVEKENSLMFTVIKRHSNLFFVSSGLGTDPFWASEVSYRLMSANNFQPIRTSDLCSRHLNQDLFTDASLRF